MGFDALTVRQGTLHVTTADGMSETIGDIQAELTGRRKGQVAGQGSFTFRGQRLAFDGTLAPPAEKPTPARWPMKLTLKGDLLEASFDGHLNVAEDLQLSGQVELASPSLRRAARWFGVPVPIADGLNAVCRQGSDQLGAARLRRRGRQGRDRRQRGGRCAGPQSCRRASADRRHAGVPCARSDALCGSGALAILPVRPPDRHVVAVRSVVPPHQACRCRSAHLGAEGRSSRATASAAAPRRSPCGRASCLPISRSSICTAAR